MEIRNTPKIDARLDTAGEVGGAAKRGGRANGNGMTEEAAPQGDRVTLTETAQRLLQAEADAGAPVDAAKVAKIRQAIADGTYTVDSAKIAARLIELDNPPRS